MTAVSLGVLLVIREILFATNISKAGDFCDKPVALHTIIMYICLLLNVLFSVYLFRELGQKYGYDK